MINRRADRRLPLSTWCQKSTRYKRCYLTSFKELGACMSLINPPLSLFLSSSFSPLSSKLLGTKDKIRRISVPFFCTILYHVRSTGNCFSLSLRRHVHKFSKYSRMLNLATTGSTLRARRHKYTATWTIMVWTPCIYLVSVLSLLLALVTDLSSCTPWIY